MEVDIQKKQIGFAQLQRENPTNLHVTHDVPNYSIYLPESNLILDVPNCGKKCQCYKFIESAIEIRSSSLTRLTLNFSKEGNPILTNQQKKYLLLSIAKCTNLEHISINSKNQVTPEIAEFIACILISQKVSLTSINLKFFFSNIALQQMTTITNAIAECTNCSSFTFELANNKLDECKAKQIGMILSRMSSLSSFHINVSSSRLDSESATAFLAEFQSAECIRTIQRLEINLSQSRILEIGSLTLSEVISQAENLKELILILRFCELGDSGVALLSKAISKRSQLEYLQLDLRNSSIKTIEQFEGISTAIPQLSQLKRLHLDFQSSLIEQDYFGKLTKAITSCEDLMELSIAIESLKFDYFCVKALTNSLSLNRNLLKIQLQFDQCPLSVRGAELLMLSLVSCKNLQAIMLSLARTGMDDEASVYLSEIIPNLEHLQVFSIDLLQNRIEGSGMSCFANAIARSKSLLRLNLDLQDNKIGRNSLKEFGSAVVKCESLIELAMNFMYCGIEATTASELIYELKEAYNLTNIRLKFGNIPDFNNSHLNAIRKRILKLVKLSLFHHTQVFY